MARQALIDGDEIVYRVAYSCQMLQWWVVKDGKRLHCNLNKNAAIESIGNDDTLDLEKEVIVTDDFVSDLNGYIHGILKTIEADSHRIFLTGDNNFRKDIATILPYKGNRTTSDKPCLYQEVRNYLLSDWDAELIDYAEADDGLSMNQWGAEKLSDTIIVTQDKDLDMVPGWHFNPRKEHEYFVEPEDGMRWFYTQLLMGDSTDNIQGIYLTGLKKAQKALEGLEVKDMYQHVLYAYDQAFKNPKVAEKMSGDKRGEERVLEVARLLWMLQFEGQLWEPRCEYSIW